MTQSFNVYSNCSGGCLLDVESDPEEHVNLALRMPQEVAELCALLEAVEHTAWLPNRGVQQRAAFDAAHQKYGVASMGRSKCPCTAQ